MLEGPTTADGNQRFCTFFIVNILSQQYLNYVQIRRLKFRFVRFLKLGGNIYIWNYKSNSKELSLPMLHVASAGGSRASQLLPSPTAGASQLLPSPHSWLSLSPSVFMSISAEFLLGS